MIKSQHQRSFEILSKSAEYHRKFRTLKVYHVDSYNKLKEEKTKINQKRSDLPRKQRSVVAELMTLIKAHNPGPEPVPFVADGPVV